VPTRLVVATPGQWLVKEGDRLGWIDPDDALRVWRVICLNRFTDPREADRRTGYVERDSFKLNCSWTIAMTGRECQGPQHHEER
jgi:hypothetical protein